MKSCTNGTGHTTSPKIVIKLQRLLFLRILAYFLCLSFFIENHGFQRWFSNVEGQFSVQISGKQRREAIICLGFTYHRRSSQYLHGRRVFPIELLTFLSQWPSCKAKHPETKRWRALPCKVRCNRALQEPCWIHLKRESKGIRHNQILGLTSKLKWKQKLYLIFFMSKKLDVLFENVFASAPPTIVQNSFEKKKRTWKSWDMWEKSTAHARTPV